MIIIAWSIYLLIAVSFSCASYCEGRAKRQGWHIARVLGLISGIVWPAMIIVVALVVAKERFLPKVALVSGGLESSSASSRRTEGGYIAGRVI
jgi:hypothetical protein